MYSDEIININAYSDEEQNILFCYGGNIPKKNNNLNEQYVVYCPDKKIGKIICNILNCSRINVSLVNDVGNYICVNGKQKLIIYKKNNKVIVSSVLVQPSDIDKDLFKLPYHIFEIIAAFLKIEIMLSIMGIDNIDFTKQKYIFDLRTFEGKIISDGENK